MNLKKKLLLCIDLGLFLTSIFLLLTSQGEVETRGLLGIVLLYISYFLFPFLSKERKEIIFERLGIYLAVAVLGLFSIYGATRFYTYNMDGGIWWQEIIAAICLIFAIGCMSYIFIDFMQTFFNIIKKVRENLFNSNSNSGYSAAKKIIEGITAFLVSITTLIASVAGLMAAISGFLK